MVDELKMKREAKKAKETEPEGKSPPKGSLYREITFAMNKEKLIGLPCFSDQYYILEPELGKKQILNAINGVVSYVGLSAVVNSIVAYTTKELSESRVYSFTVREAEEAAKFWMSLTPPIPEPPMVLFQGEEGLCFRRLEWPRDCCLPTPTFDEMMKRISNANALKAFIGSLFVLESYQQQFVWLRGEGGEGKGALMRVLARILGGGFRSLQPPTRDNKHWTQQLMGARLCVFSDCNAVGFPASGLFKSLTGGDSIMIDPKGLTTFNMTLKAKFIFLSNERPTLSSEYADMRRPIYCEITRSSQDHDTNYENKLWQEAGGFISQCLKKYHELSPRHNPIPTDNDLLGDWVNIVEEPFEALIQEHMTFNPTFTTTPIRMQGLLQEKFKDRKTQLAFMDYLKRKHHVVKDYPPGQKQDNPRRMYLGVKTRWGLE